ncbi:helicase-related protein [Vibrio mediterranei]|uniref:helicase-related protein n=1 Tax=Vibrio mediterranei TaxID=689 RepID=UPI0040677D82
MNVLSTLIDEERLPTNSEKAIINEFDGYGKATKAFNPSHERYDELKRTFDGYSDTAFDMASRGVLTSYFTDDEIVDAMWRSVLRLGVHSGNAIEPSAGSGTFIKRSPGGFDGKFFAVELDPITSEVCKHTTNAKTYTGRLEKTRFPSVPYSLVIGNPPYGSIPARSDEFGKLNILPYFMLRSLKELHEGGICAFVVSSWLLDSEDSTIREHIASQANLVAHARLPSNAFKRRGADGVTTDIILLQKTNTPDTAPEWVNTIEGDGYRINAVYDAHPERVLGTIEAPSEFSYATCLVNYRGDSFETDLNEILDAQTPKAIFFQNIVNKGIGLFEESMPESDASEYATNELFVSGDSILQKKSNDTAIKLDISSKVVKGRYLAYIDVKNALNALLDAEKEDKDEYTIRDLRTKLVNSHALFCKKYGPLSRSSNRTKLRLCSQYLRAKALELNYVAASKEEGTQESYQDATILKERVYRRPIKPTKAENPTEACVLSKLETGRIDADYLALLLGMDKQDAIQRCLEANAIFLEPVTQEYELAVTYLSGNIYEKITTAIEHNTDGLYDHNIQALEDAKPERLKFEDINVTIGATWVGPDVYVDFLKHLGGDTMRPTIMQLCGKWEVMIIGGDYTKCRKWSTADRDLKEMYSSVLNGKPIVIRRTDSDGNSYIDREATFEANEMAEKIIEEFALWLPKSAERRIDITKNYNEKMNSFVVPSFDAISEHLVINNCTLDPRPHQRRAIMRGLLTNASFGDMCVGSGKTLIIQSIVMKLREINKNHRAVIAMPNPLVAQFTTSFLETFPASNVLCIPDKCSPKEREELLNIALTTSVDAIIMPETTLKALQNPQDTESTLIKEEIEELRNAIMLAKEGALDGRAQKRLQRSLEKKESDLETLLNTEKYESITFEDLNPDFLALDEAQLAKNLAFTSQMTGVKGMGSPSGSKRAFDFFVKARHTLADNGKVFLATGTSISNSITEIVAWLRMLCHGTVSSDILNVDSFIKCFATPVQDLEIDATGRNLKMTTSLKRFNNLPELLRIYRSIAEVISLDQLKEALPRLADGRPAIPPLAGGEIKTEILNISPEQNAYFLELVEMAKNLTKENNMLKIMDLARKCSLDYRNIDPDSRPLNTISDKVVQNVVKFYNESREFKGTQVIFCDRSISMRHRNSETDYWTKLFDKAEKGDQKAIAATEGLELESVLSTLKSDFSVYDTIEQKLTDYGIKVAVVHDYKSDTQKRILKSKINSGEVAVVIGSTSKLGVGWNINERGYALHNVDLPLRPGDYLQRIGRFDRQGNKAYEQGLINEVHYLNYVTERTLDSWFLNLLDKKTGYINQFNNGDLSGKRTYEPETEVIDFSSLSALVTGQDEFIELAKTRLELKKLKTRNHNLQTRKFRAEETVEYCTSEIERLTNLMPNIESDQANAIELKASVGFNPTFPNHIVRGKTENQTFKNALDSARNALGFRETKPKSVCSFGEFDFTISRDSVGTTFHLRRDHQYEIKLTGYFAGHQALSNRINEMLNALTEIADNVKVRIARLHDELAHAKTETTIEIDNLDQIKALTAKVKELETTIAKQEQREREEAQAKKEAAEQSASDNV